MALAPPPSAGEAAGDEARRSRAARRRLRLGDFGRGLLGLVGAVLGVQLASWLLPSFEVSGWAGAVSAAISLAVAGFLLRPVLVWLAVWTGWPGAVLIGLFGQALVVWLAVYSPTGASEVTPLSAFVASWIIAGVSTTFVWAATAGTDDAATASLLRKARRRPSTVPDPDVPGIVFVQADGVPYPVLEWGVKAGTLPTLSRWVRSGSHHMAEWRPMLPATTPASQMGLLHGTIEGIPAFRWLDRATGKVLVANRPADARVIEATHSDGRGLLADDGVSISNLFTGDAPTAYVTMSAVGRSQESREARAAVSRFLARPDGLARGVTRTVSEVVRERFQAHRATRRDVRPRVHRGWGFAAERAGLNGVLRDLNTALVAESMLRGSRAIYVDYVDYDAVAHHAGLMQPESLAALEGMDRVLAQLQEVAQVAPRRYHFVVLSDHGQSQGAVFAERYGENLATLVSRLAEVDVTAAEKNPEGLGRLNSIFAGSAGQETVLGRAMASVSQRLVETTYAAEREAQSTESAERAEQPASEPAPSAAAEPTEEFLVFGSGNLGLVYVAGEGRRVTLEELAVRYPALLPGLAGHPGVGFIVAWSDEHGPVAIGAAGEHRVREGVVVGEDPLAPFGEQAAAFVLRAASMPEAPDVLVNSLLDEMGEVAAFEGLVGCHGGLGGWQDRAMIVWPKELDLPDEMVVGAHTMHAVLVGWLERLGHRAELAGDAERAATAS